MHRSALIASLLKRLGDDIKAPDAGASGDQDPPDDDADGEILTGKRIAGSMRLGSKPSGGGNRAGGERILDSLQRELAGLKLTIAAIARHHGIREIVPLAPEDSEGALRAGRERSGADSGLHDAPKLASKFVSKTIFKSPTMKRDTSFQRGTGLAFHKSPTLKRDTPLQRGGADPSNFGQHFSKPSTTLGGIPEGPTLKPLLEIPHHPIVKQAPSSVVGFHPMAPVKHAATLEALQSEVVHMTRPQTGHQAQLLPRDSAKDDSSGNSSVVAPISRDVAVSSVTNALLLLSADYDRALQHRQAAPKAVPKHTHPRVEFRHGDMQQELEPGSVIPSGSKSTAVPPVEAAKGDHVGKFTEDGGGHDDVDKP